MKVTGPTGPTTPQPGRAARSGGGFNLPSGAPASTSASTATAATSSLAGVSSLMALQGVEDATERRRRAIRRGGGLLDRLDELKLALLSGQSGTGALERLARTLREERPGDAEPELALLLDHIDTRAAVELAKAEMRAR